MPSVLGICTKSSSGRKEGRKVGFPRFKSANAWNTIQLRDAANCLDNGCFKAPKQMGGRIRVIVHRPLEGTFKFARIVLRPSGWYVQCVCETEPHPLPKKNNAVGLDMGIRYLIADSNGGIVENPRHAKKSAKKLARAQRKLAKCKKGSHRRKKAKRLVARMHERIANQRKDTLHKASRRYVDGYQTLVIENLKPANMVRNHCLAFAISDAFWGMFRQFLQSKAESADRQVIAVAPHYTSQKCSRCKEYVYKSLSVRTHMCPHCVTPVKGHHLSGEQSPTSSGNGSMPNVSLAPKREGKDQSMTPREGERWFQQTGASLRAISTW
jgi:putative transposase